VTGLSPRFSGQCVRQQCKLHQCNTALHELVGLAGFEPTASSSRTKRATRLRHSPCAAGDKLFSDLGPASKNALGELGRGKTADETVLLQQKIKRNPNHPIHRSPRPSLSLQQRASILFYQLTFSTGWVILLRRGGRMLGVRVGFIIKMSRSSLNRGSRQIRSPLAWLGMSL
jgi:hypothetical protein